MPSPSVPSGREIRAAMRLLGQLFLDAAREIPPGAGPEAPEPGEDARRQAALRVAAAHRHLLGVVLALGGP